MERTATMYHDQYSDASKNLGCYENEILALCSQTCHCLKYFQDVVKVIVVFKDVFVPSGSQVIFGIQEGKTAITAQVIISLNFLDRLIVCWSQSYCSFKDIFMPRDSLANIQDSGGKTAITTQVTIPLTETIILEKQND